MKIKNNKLLPNYLQYASLGLQMIIIMGSFSWAGLMLDKYLAIKFPVFLSLFSVGSTILSIYITIKKLLHQIKKEK